MFTGDGDKTKVFWVAGGGNIAQSIGYLLYRVI